MSSAFGWLTPNTVTPTSFICRVLQIPNELGYVEAVNGALLELAEAFNWEQFGTATPDEAAQNMWDMWQAYLFSDGCMIGSVFPFITTDPPPNCLLCDGTVYNRVDYPDLYGLIDSAFILDADSFFVPDLRDQFVPGAGLSYVVSETGGLSQVTLVTAEMPSHSHLDTGHTHVDGVATPIVLPVGPLAPLPSAVPGVGVTGIGNANISSAGGDGAHENRPPFTALKYAVKAR